MSEKSFIVPNISCGHCTHTIINEVGEIEGVSYVNAEIDTKRVTVNWDEPASWEQIVSLLQEIDYPPQQLITLQ